METMKDYEKELEESYKEMDDKEEKDMDEMTPWEKVEKYREDQTILEVKISGIVNKGVIAMVEGLRGFIPASRLSLRRVDDLNEWLGKEIRVRVITVDPEKNRLVLSAREILREEREEKRAQRIAGIAVGTVLEAKVDSLKDYGAFVDLGEGLSGLVHVSQISTQRVKKPSDVLEVGQPVKVKVIGKKDGKLSLSIKALQQDKKRAEEVKVDLPKSEDIGTSLGDLLKGLDL